jgi:ribonuclease HII
MTTVKHNPSLNKTEKRRLQLLLEYEKAAEQQGYQLVAGIDEAGRGPLAGPVVAAACIIPCDLLFPGVNDSKQLSADVRAELFQKITGDSRVYYGVGIVSHQEIDRINIYQATIVAMLQAIAGLPCKPDFLLVDGLQLPHPTIPCQKIIQGDCKSHSIAAASIIAKVTRDRMMVALHQQWPSYGFDQHKGYATRQHVEAIKKWGPCPIHRLSFEPIKSLFSREKQLSFDFT